MLRKKKDENQPKVSKKIELAENDVAIVLRADSRSETICTLHGKHTLTPQEEIVIALGGLLQQGKFVDSLREYFYSTMQNMLTTKMQDDMTSD
jgi:hypothetical protein